MQQQLGHASLDTTEIYTHVLKSGGQAVSDIDDWLIRVEKIPAISFLPVDNRIAIRSTTLPEPFHPDPADRMIVATARELGTPLITAD